MADESLTPETLSGRNLKAVADYIKAGKAERIVVMTGAGISTAAGSLYATLARLKLPYAEAVFDIDYFRKHPEPFYCLAKELYPGHFHPTVSHAFIALLAHKGLLLMNFTQNIDCLERRAGVPSDLIIEAHGSFATQRCIACQAPFPDDAMRRHVLDEVLEALWRGVVGDEEAERQRAAAETGGEEIRDEVDKLTREVESALRLDADDGGEEGVAEATLPEDQDEKNEGKTSEEAAKPTLLETIDTTAVKETTGVDESKPRDATAKADDDSTAKASHTPTPSVVDKPTRLSEDPGSGRDPES
ncbi:ATP-dependent RNA helicase DBP10 [Verticillium dahliae VDG2]|nr:ATP-dependent RNA helicase DBP10 [Verticillium dahliae VDG2]